MLHHLFLVAGFAFIAFAAPNAGPVSKPKCYDDNYDELPVSPVPALNTVSAVNGLEYTGFVVAKPIPATNGYKPHSGTNNIAAAITHDLDTGNLNGLSLTPFGVIAAGPGVSSYSLQSFYFACVIASQTTLATRAESCTISVTGFKTSGEQLPAVPFAFSNTQAVNDMYFAVLPASYTGIKNVTIGVANGAVATAGTVLAVDDWKHCNSP